MKKFFSKKDNKRAAIFVLLAILIYLLVDYFNIPHFLGVSANRVNADFLGIFLNAAIVIGLYIVTYRLIDSRQIQKEENARNTVNVLLLQTYRSCLDNLQLLEIRGFIEEYIIPKVDGNKVPEENQVVANLQNFPYGSNAEILELATGGYIEKEELTNYLYIRGEYKHIIDMKIIFYDLTAPKTADQQDLYEDIYNRRRKLIELLRREIKRLEGTA